VPEVEVGNERRPRPVWYLAGVAMTLFGLYAWWPVFNGMDRYGHLPERERPELVARAVGGTPTAFDVTKTGQYSAALRAWFGFGLEGDVSTNHIDPYDIPVYGFRTADPTGAEQSVRQACTVPKLSHRA
jgi:hypothetical protein